jgi:DNA-directed RNA polymerase
LKRTGGITQDTGVNAVIVKWQFKFAIVIEKLREAAEGQSDHEPLIKDGLKQLDQTKLTNSLFLSLLEPLSAETVALVVIRQLMRVNEYNIAMNGYPMSILARSIGDALQNEVFAVQILDKTFQKMTKSLR